MNGPDLGAGGMAGVQPGPWEARREGAWMGAPRGEGAGERPLSISSSRTCASYEEVWSLETDRWLSRLFVLDVRGDARRASRTEARRSSSTRDALRRAPAEGGECVFAMQIANRRAAPRAERPDLAC